MWDLQANICIYTRFVVNMYLHISCNALWFMYMLNLAGTRACPRAFHARGWRARAWFVARGGSRARVRAGDLAGGHGCKKAVSAGTTPVAIFSLEQRIRRRTAPLDPAHGTGVAVHSGRSGSRAGSGFTGGLETGSLVGSVYFFLIH